MKNLFLTTEEGMIAESQLIPIQIARSPNGRPFEILAFSTDDELPRVLYCGDRVYSLVLTEVLGHGRVVGGEGKEDLISHRRILDTIRRRHIIGGKRMLLGIRILLSDPVRRWIRTLYPGECALYEEGEAA